MSKKRGNRLPPFVYITRGMLKSKAFKELTNPARTAYLLLQSQITSQNQTEIILPYSQIEEYMDRNTFSRSVKQLEKLGFIIKKQKGGLYRTTNIYSFSEKWKLFQPKPKTQNPKVKNQEEKANSQAGKKRVDMVYI